MDDRPEPNSLAILVKKNFLTNYFNELLEKLYELYETTWKDTHKLLPPSIAADALPYVRHWQSMALMKIVAENLDMSYTYNQNKAKNCSHVRVAQGNLIMTISRATSPQDVIRPAWFRKNLALVNQRWLPGLNITGMSDENIYAVVIHGADPHNSKHLGFAHLVAPAPNQKEYICRLNLDEIKPIASCNTADIEIIEPRSSPRLVRKEKKKVSN